jgi:hypothetical protein
MFLLIHMVGAEAFLDDGAFKTISCGMPIADEDSFE